jgi:hypothetical protein
MLKSMSAKIAATACFTLFCFSAMAAGLEPGTYERDDFGGARFATNSHSALRENSEKKSAITSPQEIEPAAGAVGTKQESQAEQELEEKFDAKVDQTVIDRGDHEIMIRDRIGGGDVGIFYDNKKDNRINDQEDAIGVELRLMEFD